DFHVTGVQTCALPIFAVPAALAQEHDLRTMADLARYVNAGNPIKLAASQEFVDRDDALPAFERTYGFELSDEQLVILAGGNTTRSEERRVGEEASTGW